MSSNPVIDIHAHLHVPDADLILARVPAPPGLRPPLGGTPLTDEVTRKYTEKVWPKMTLPEERLVDMDRLGIEVQALSPSPQHYNIAYPAEVAARTARISNQRVAEVCARYPDRFVGLGNVPLQDPDLAIAELDRCVEVLGLRGVQIGTHVNGAELTRAGLEGFFERLEELDVLLFIHPLGTTLPRMGEHYFPNTVGHLMESTLAIGYLIFDGYLQRYQNVKVCVAHGGGAAVAHRGRFDHAYAVREDCRVNISQPPSSYMRRLHVDTIVYDESHLRQLVEVYGYDHVLLGTDYPYDMTEADPVGLVTRTALAPDERAAILGGNAARLLKLTAGC